MASIRAIANRLGGKIRLDLSRWYRHRHTTGDEGRCPYYLLRFEEDQAFTQGTALPVMQRHVIGPFPGGKQTC